MKVVKITEMKANDVGYWKPGRKRRIKITIVKHLNNGRTIAEGPDGTYWINNTADIYIKETK